MDYLTHIMDYLSKSITDPTNKYLPHFCRILDESFIVRFDSIQERRLNWSLVSLWSNTDQEFELENATAAVMHY